MLRVSCAIRRKKHSLYVSLRWCLAFWSLPSVALSLFSGIFIIRIMFCWSLPSYSGQLKPFIECYPSFFWDIRPSDYVLLKPAVLQYRMPPPFFLECPPFWSCSVEACRPIVVNWSLSSNAVPLSSGRSVLWIMFCWSLPSFHRMPPLFFLGCPSFGLCSVETCRPTVSNAFSFFLEYPPFWSCSVEACRPIVVN